MRFIGCWFAVVVLTMGALCAGLAQLPYAQVRAFRSKDGLAENKITSAGIDRDGLIWFASTDELNRFDGSRFRIFPLRNEKGDPIPNAIQKMRVMDDGTFFLHYDLEALVNCGFFDPVTAKTRSLDISVLPAEARFVAALSDEKNRIYLLSHNSKTKKDDLYTFTPSRSLKHIKSLGIILQDRNLLRSPRHQMGLMVVDNHLWYCAGDGKIEAIEISGKNTIQYTGYYKVSDYIPFRPDLHPVFFFAGNKTLFLLDEASQQVFRFDPVSARWYYVLTLPEPLFPTSFDQTGNVAFTQTIVYPPVIKKLYFFNGSTYHLDAVEGLASDITDVLGGDFYKGFLAHSIHGIYQYKNNASRVRNYLNQTRFYFDQNYELSLFPVRGLAQKDSQHLFVMTPYNDLMMLHLETGSAQRIEALNLQTGQKEPVGGDYSKIVKDRSGRLWIDKFPYLHCVDPDHQTFQQFDLISHDFLEWDEPYMLVLCPPHMGGVPDIVRLNKHTGQRESLIVQKSIPSLWNETMPTCFHMDSIGRLWIGTEKALFAFDPENRSFVPLKNWDGRVPSPVSCIQTGADGSVWIGTLGAGLLRYWPESGKKIQYGREEGLPNQKIAGMLPDKNNLWVSTYDGLAYFYEDKNSFLRFYQEDGLCHNEFNRRSYLALPDGRFCFGTINGLSVFERGDLLPGQAEEPRLLKLSSLTQSNGKSLIHQLLALDTIVRISLPASNRYFAMEFFLKDAAVQNPVQISYKIAGIQEHWTHLSDNRLELHWLPSGTYTLQVRGSDQYGAWSEPFEMVLHVKALFYQTWWFWSLLALLVGIVAFRFQHLAHARQIDRVKGQQYKEMHDLKTRFFSYITHEFRTPLTLILGYAQFGLDADSRENPHFAKIKSAGLRLLELVNQMLDLNKAESGKMSIVPHLGDLSVFVAAICKNLESLAARKGITVDFQSESQPFMADFDKDIIQKVVENLLTNAIKFAPNDSLIAVNLRKSPVQDHAPPGFEISVQDQGAGIPQQEIPALFQPFYQMENKKSVTGTGLGLALVRELVHQCGGSIDVVSIPEKGTCFTVKLPLSTHSIPIRDTFDLSPIDPSSRFTLDDDSDVRPHQSNPENAPWVLIVEDNPEVRSYVTRCLQEHYRLLTAENGRIGLELAIQQVPDIIISDVMMPEMDGFAFLENIRTSSVTSHIPFIMLTARGDMEDRLKGLGKGANIYLPKPFDPRELQLSVSNLLSLQEKNRIRYESYTWKTQPKHESAAEKEESLSGIQAEPVEDPFFTSLVQYIETNIHSSELDNEELCRAMGMSRSQLNRKVTALTGHPPVKLVRRLRVKKAMVMLKLDRDATISEIAYDCGFSSPAYFTRVFQSEVGIAPSDFREMR